MRFGTAFEPSASAASEGGLAEDLEAAEIAVSVLGVLLPLLDAFLEFSILVSSVFSAAPLLSDFSSF